WRLVGSRAAGVKAGRSAGRLASHARSGSTGGGPPVGRGWGGGGRGPETGKTSLLGGGFWRAVGIGRPGPPGGGPEAGGAGRAGRVGRSDRLPVGHSRTLAGVGRLLIRDGSQRHPARPGAAALAPDHPVTWKRGVVEDLRPAILV